MNPSGKASQSNAYFPQYVAFGTALRWAEFSTISAAVSIAILPAVNTALGTAQYTAKRSTFSPTELATLCATIFAAQCKSLYTTFDAAVLAT